MFLLPDGVVTVHVPAYANKAILTTKKIAGGVSGLQTPIQVLYRMLTFTIQSFLDKNQSHPRLKNGS